MLMLLEAVSCCETSVEETCAVEAHATVVSNETDVWSDVNCKTDRKLLEEDTELCLTGNTEVYVMVTSTYESTDTGVEEPPSEVWSPCPILRVPNMESCEAESAVPVPTETTLDLNILAVEYLTNELSARTNAKTDCTSCVL